MKTFSAALALLLALCAPFALAQSNPSAQAKKVPALAPGDKMGTVKWFNDAKAYGFIGQDDKGPDLFVSIGAIDMTGFKTLKPGQRVIYQVLTTSKGTQAMHVRPAR
jgi:CspA family cold shock protein